MLVSMMPVVKVVTHGLAVNLLIGIQLLISFIHRTGICSKDTLAPGIMVYSLIMAAGTKRSTTLE